MEIQVEMKQEEYDKKCKMARQVLVGKSVVIEDYVKSLKKKELHNADMNLVLALLDKNIPQTLAVITERVLAGVPLNPQQVFKLEVISSDKIKVHKAICARNIPVFAANKCRKGEASTTGFSADKILVVLRYALILLAMTLCGVIMLKNHRTAIQIMLRVFGKGEPGSESLKKNNGKNRKKNKGKETTIEAKLANIILRIAEIKEEIKKSIKKLRELQRKSSETSSKMTEETREKRTPSKKDVTREQNTATGRPKSEHSSATPPGTSCDNKHAERPAPESRSSNFDNDAQTSSEDDEECQTDST
jgi:hypothetical protein